MAPRHLAVTLGLDRDIFRVVDADPSAARFERLFRDYFIGAVEELYEAPAEVLPIFLVAYDADGQEVARRKIDAGWFRLD